MLEYKIKLIKQYDELIKTFLDKIHDAMDKNLIDFNTFINLIDKVNKLQGVYFKKDKFYENAIITLKKYLIDLDNQINDTYLKNSRTYGYDHHYFFKEINELIPQVKLSNNEYELNIYTNYSGVQIYTDNYPDNYKWEQLTDNRRRSIAIEPQDNTLNREILKAKDEYIRFIKAKAPIKSSNLCKRFFYAFIMKK